MSNHTTTNHTHNDQVMWSSLKVAIASTSGFKRWQKNQPSGENSLEQQVSQYLEETLATLAY